MEFTACSVFISAILWMPALCKTAVVQEGGVRRMKHNSGLQGAHGICKERDK